MIEDYAFEEMVKENEQLRAELDTLRPAAEALKTAVEWATASPSGLCLAWFDGNVAIGTDEKLSEEPTNGDPLAATIRAITRAAEAIGER